MSPTPVPEPGTGQTGLGDPTRSVTPSVPVQVDIPGTIFVPPPTVPSTTQPVLLPRAGGPGVPPAAVLDFGFSVTASEEYSDNFNLSSGQQKQSNFRSVLTPGATLGINGAFTKGVIQYGLSAARDSSDRSEETQIFHSLVGSVSWEASPRLKLTLSEALTRSDEPTQADRLSLRRERRTFTSNNFRASADYLIDRISTSAFYSLGTFRADPDERNTAHTAGVNAGITVYETNTISVGYDYLMSTSEGQATVQPDTNLAAGASDITGHRLTATYSRQLSTLLTAGITGSYAVRRTEGARSTSFANNNFDSWSVSLFNSYSTPKLTLAGSVGYSQILPESGKAEPGVTSTSTLAYRFARAVASIGVDSGFSETFAGGENFGVVQTRGVTGSLTYPFTPSIQGTVASFYRNNQTTGSNGSFGDREENTWGANVFVSVQITRWLNMLLEYNHSETTSNQPIGRSFSSVNGVNSVAGDQVENRARISLTVSF